MLYIPILKSLQAEQLALKNISERARKKIKPLLQYVTDKKTEDIIKDNPDICFFLEFPDLPFNRDVRTLSEKEERFAALKEKFSNFFPVVTITEKANAREIVQHTLQLLGEYGFDKALIKAKILDDSGEIDNMQLTKLIALYSCLPLDRSLFLIDFERIQNTEIIFRYLPTVMTYLKGAKVGFTATIWPPSQSTYPKDDMKILDNYPYLAFLSFKDKLCFYSDYLTENPRSAIGSVDFPLTIIPYFKWISLDGEKQVIIRAESSRASAKELAAAFIDDLREGFLHNEGCKGCEEFRRVADLSDPEKDRSSPMTRKRAAFVHYIEVIASLI